MISHSIFYSSVCLSISRYPLGYIPALNVQLKLALSNNNSEVDKENHSPLNINKTFNWTDVSTKLFLELYKEKRELLINRKIKTICENMKSHGFNVTTMQVENKWKSLERSYKNMILNNKQTGRGRVTCFYET